MELYGLSGFARPSKGASAKMVPLVVDIRSRRWEASPDATMVRGA